jgi:hypothetical protein
MLEKIWPDSFTHWKVTSSKKNAVLCEVTKIRKELGLFWKFNSPNSEFAYLPAVFPRDDKGQIKMSSDWKEDRSLLIDFGRKPDDLASHDHVLCRREEVEELYSFRFNFKEGAAKAYAELLKQVDRGTEDYDDTIFVQKIEPSTSERLKPVLVLPFLAFCLLFWIIIILLIFDLIFGK